MGLHLRTSACLAFYKDLESLIWWSACYTLVSQQPLHQLKHDSSNFFTIFELFGSNGSSCLASFYFISSLLLESAHLHAREATLDRVVFTITLNIKIAPVGRLVISTDWSWARVTCIKERRYEQFMMHSCLTLKEFSAVFWPLFKFSLAFSVASQCWFIQLLKTDFKDGCPGESA